MQVYIYSKCVASGKVAFYRLLASEIEAGQSVSQFVAAV